VRSIWSRLSASCVGMFVLVAAGGGLASSGVAFAAQKQLVVCQTGCSFSSIQAAIAAADDGDIVKVGTGTYAGSLTFAKSLTLIGAGAGNTTITQSGVDSAIKVGPGVSTTIKAVAVVGGQAEVCDGNGCNGQGGGISNSGVLKLVAATVANNQSAGTGGGVYNDGTVTLIDCVVSGNRAGSGGGITNLGTATLNDTIVRDNAGAQPSINGFSGGGIFNRGTLTLNDTTVSGNVVGTSLTVGTAGGGIDNSGGSVTLNDSVVSGNSAGRGGGISNAGSVTLRDSAISANNAIVGGGIDNGGMITLRGTVLTGNSAVFGGGISNGDGADAHLYDSAVVRNVASVTGGGIYNVGGSVALIDSAVNRNDPDDLVGV
jgi:hypothetical protein